jgi:hypothetical protein
LLGASSKPIAVSIGDVLGSPLRFEGVRITAIGYYDAKERTLANTRDSADHIVVDVPEAQAKNLKSGEVHATGTIRCIDLTQKGPAPNQRVSPLKSSQFRGVYSTHIVDISMLAHGHGGDR